MRDEELRTGRVSTAWATLAMLTSVLVASDSSAQETPVATRSGAVVQIPVEGLIELGVAPFIERSLEEAAESGVALVVLELNTPGGRVDAAERIADALQDSRVPVVAFVNRQAYSAGALIALATDAIYMRPGSVIGAATPVTGEGQKASEKIVSAMRSRMRSLAEAASLDPTIAEAMVDEDIEIPGLIEAGKLLTLTAEEAVEVGYAQLVPDRETLLAELGYASAPVETARINWAERLVRFFSHPVVAPFLLTLGFLGLITEVKTAGFGIGGAAGILALSLYFGSHLIIGLAGWEEVILVGVGLVLVAVEVFVIPGFGVFGILGGLGVLGGLYMSQLGDLPTMPDFARAGSVITTTLLLVIIVGWALLRHLPKSERLRQAGIFLSREEDDPKWASSVRRSELVGRVGTAVTDLRPAGTGLFGEERIDVVSDSEWIEAGSPIRVVSTEGYRNVVRPVTGIDEGGPDSEIDGTNQVKTDNPNQG